MSDEELDNLFRKGAESFDPPYDPEAWHAMERKLDNAGAGHSWWFKFLFPLLIMIYTCSLVADSRLPDVPGQRLENVNTKSPEKALTGTRQQKIQTARKVKQQPSGLEQKYHEERNTKSKTAGNSAERPSAAKEVLRTDTRLNARPQRQQQREAKVVQLPTEGKGTTEPPMQPSAIQRTAVVGLPVTEVAEADLFVPAVTVAHDSLLLPPATQPEQAALPDSSSLHRKNRREGVFLRKVQLNLLLAPDFTTVKFKNPNAVSTNAGLVIGVPISNKWSLVTGFVWANKVYEANPEDYDGYWSSSYLPASIDATCRVFDIPLNIRYQVLEWGENSFAVQAGLSSYIMLRENYSYNYATYSRAVAYKNANKHLFGVQNLSVSYARRASPDFSVGVGPFVKVPLTGIGAGHVKLSSAGVFFTASYTLHLKR